MLHIDTCFKPISLTNSIMPNIFSALTIPKPEILRELRLFKPASAAQEFSQMGVSASEIMESKIREMDELITRMTKGEKI